MTHPNLSTFGGLKEGDLYIERAADAELLAALHRNEYAYVLASRQTGKTSLMLRTLRKLRAEGVRCAKIDLGVLGSDIAQEAWYSALAMELAEALDLDDSFVEGVLSRWSRLTPVQRFIRFLRETISLSSQPLVIFVDEIEGFLKLPMRMADDFLAAIRSLYNDRDREPAYRRLSFCLMGVCTPTELIRDERRTPFNVARGISLEDFSWDEVRAGFLPVLAGLPAAEPLLQRIFHWTHGHPYLTHRLVRDLVQFTAAGSTTDSAWIDRTVREQFVGGLGREQENFLEAERRLSLGQAHRARQRLSLYKSIRQGQVIAARGRDPIQLELRLTGLICEQRREGAEPILVVRNRIFAELFDASWAPKSDPGKLDPAYWMKEQIERWTDFGRKDAFVLRGEELHEAKGWAEREPTLDPAVKEFLDASERVDSRERSIRLYSLLWTLLWTSFANFLLVPLLPHYWRYRGYSSPELIPFLYGLPFVLALPSGLLADRARVRPATMLLSGLGVIVAAMLLLVSDLFLPQRGLAFIAVAFLILGQVLQRPHVAVLVGMLYPRSDRRLDLTYLAYYFFVNLGALLGPLVGAAAFSQYGWLGVLATAGGGSAFALYSFAASKSVFHALNLPLRAEPLEPTTLQIRRRRAVLLLTATMLIFWMAFYALGNTLHPITGGGQPAPQSGLATGNLLAQGLASEAITPLFVLALAPLLAALTYLARRLNREPTAPTKIALGMLLLGALMVALSQAQSNNKMLGPYITLTLAELLIVPASMSMATALSSSSVLSTMMGGYFLVMGVGAWFADLSPQAASWQLPALALAAILSALTFALRRRPWTALFPRSGEQSIG